MANRLLKLLKSPVLHLLILGTVGFFGYKVLKPSGNETIRVSSQTIDALVQQEESLSQIPVSEERKQLLIRSYIEDEILIREAYKQKLDKGDSRVRKRILNIMRSSLTEDVPEPSSAQLRTYYKENQVRYLTGPSRSFSNVYFSFNNSDLPNDPQSFIAQLKRSPIPEAQGEIFSMGGNYSKHTFRQTSQMFGKPFAERLFNSPLNQWTGPVESFKGIHYVIVTAKHDPELPSFETMQAYLRGDYIMTRMREGQESKIEKMARNYEIIIEGK